MKNILFIVHLSFGPGLQVGTQPLVMSLETSSAEACQAEADRQRSSHGRIGNLPGYRYVAAAWCEDRDEPWPHHDAPLIGGEILKQGPFIPRDEIERDEWTPVLWPEAKSTVRKLGINETPSH